MAGKNGKKKPTVGGGVDVEVPTVDLKLEVGGEKSRLSQAEDRLKALRKDETNNQEKLNLDEQRNRIANEQAATRVASEAERIQREAAQKTAADAVARKPLILEPVAKTAKEYAAAGIASTDPKHDPLEIEAPAKVEVEKAKADPAKTIVTPAPKQLSLQEQVDDLNNKLTISKKETTAAQTLATNTETDRKAEQAAKATAQGELAKERAKALKLPQRWGCWAVVALLLVILFCGYEVGAWWYSPPVGKKADVATSDEEAAALQKLKAANEAARKAHEAAMEALK